MNNLAAIQALCEEAHPYGLGDRQKQLFLNAMKESVRWHREQSPFYRRLLERHAFHEGQLASYEDCKDVPFILASFFKAHELLSVKKSHVVAQFTSSGTTGQKSQIFFDHWSMTSGQRMLDYVFDYHGWVTPHQRVNYLLYSYETEPDSRLGTSYTDHYLCRYSPAESVFHALKRTGSGGGHEFDVFGCIRYLQTCADEGLPVRIFGFPAFLYFTLQRMRDLKMNPFKLSPESLVFLGGGWKGHADQAISKRDLYDQICEQLGIPDERLRDGFGSVEHPIPYIECRHHQFHVPVWSQVAIRDVRTFARLQNGLPGFLHLISPYITSMPAQSVLMGDMAVLYDGADCPCEIETPYFVVQGRAGTSKNRSCAIAAAELLGQASGASGG